MKLLFINQYYWPDVAATAQMMQDLCCYLSARGHEVHVLCSRGAYDIGSRTPGATQPPGARTARYEQHRGVHIHRITATGFGKRRMIGRILDYATFHLLIGLRMLLTGWRYHALVTLTTPPLVGIYATPVRLLTAGRTRHVCWVMDLHPDCEFELGLFKRTSLGPRLLDWLNGLHFRRADADVVLGEFMAQRLVAKRVPKEKIHVIPVWGHDEPESHQASPSAQQSPATPVAGSSTSLLSLRTELGLDGKFIVMYSGNAGLVHTFDAICEVARLLHDDPRFVFLFVGGGRRIAEIETFAKEHALTNLRIKGYLPRERLGESLPMADLHLITLRDGMAGCAVPSKLYGILAAGRPALYVGPQSEISQTLQRFDCGLSFGSADATGLAAALRTLADDPAARQRMGEHARRAYESQFTPTTGCEAWRQLLEQVGPPR